MDYKDMNNNILSNLWEKKYAEQPTEIKEKLERLNNMELKEYQLQVIKRKRIYPQIGDVFEIKPKENILLYGTVINNHIANLNGDDLILIMIFKENSSMKEKIDKGIDNEDLLIPPLIVGKEYWTRGYFFNVTSVEDVSNVTGYGFYDIVKGIFCNEYGAEVEEEPKLLGTYGVATISGVARIINEELIILGMI